MKNQIRKRILIFVVVGGLSIEAKEGFSFNVQRLIEEAKAKCTRFEKRIEDMSICQQIIEFSPTKEKEIVSEIKLFKKKKKWRLESAIIKPLLQGKKTILIHDGRDTWMITSLGKRRLSAEESKNIQLEGNWWNLMTEKAKIVGTESLNGRECYIIGLKEGNSPITRMWIDKKDLVLIKAKGISGKDKILIWEYSDFREVDRDWKIPYKTEIYLNNEIVSTVLTEYIEINKGLPDELFDPNKEKALKVFDILKEMIK